MSKTLFIGGPLEGERIELREGVNHYKSIVAPVLHNLVAYGPDPVPVGQTIEEVIYVRIRMTNGMTVFTLDGFDPVNALIANYEPKLKSRIRDLLMEFIGSDSLISNTGWGILDKIKNATKY